MPGKAKPPRLFLRKGNGRKPSWVIRHGSIWITLGLAEDRLDEAREALRKYCKKAGPYDPEEPAPVSSRMDNIQGTIYFISCALPEFPIKIGWATNVEERIRQLQTGFPHEIEVLATESPRTIHDEKWFHGLFHTERIRGEWFKRSDRLMRFITTGEIIIPNLGAFHYGTRPAKP
jgi:hypothetical protein